jgi:hypothetical protein
MEIKINTKDILNRLESNRKTLHRAKEEILDIIEQHESIEECIDESWEMLLIAINLVKIARDETKNNLYCGRDELELIESAAEHIDSAIERISEIT